MTAPFILISTWKVKEGAYRDYEAWFQGLVAHVESGNPRMIAFHAFASEDGSKLMGVQVHPDTASMEHHLRLVAEYAAAAQQAYLDQPLHLLVGGEGDQAREQIHGMAQSRGDLMGFPLHSGGFTRSSAAS